MDNKTILKYHHAIFDLMGIEPVISPAAQAIIAEREKLCGITFPASVKEYFSLEGAAEIFENQASPDYLVQLKELGNPEEVAEGYLKVAYENQGAVVWFVRLNGSDDPPVFHDNNEYFATLGLTGKTQKFSEIDWQFNSATFTEFIYEMFSFHHFTGYYTGLRLAALDDSPDEAMLNHLRSLYKEGPHSDLCKTNLQQAKVDRFYTRHGLIRITYRWNDITKAEWVFDADSPEVLEEFVKSVWHYGTLAETLTPDCFNYEAKNKGQAFLEAIRANQTS